MSTSSRVSPTDLARLFDQFARSEAQGASPLYFQLAQEVAKDEEILELASNTLRSQPPPNMLFGAVHFLLLRGITHPLSNFYSSLSDSPAPAADAYPHFRNFCLAHRNEIKELLATRLVQTNEVSRCSSLLPAFAVVERLSDGHHWFMVDIGASAGLNLNWDRYSYDFGRSRWGPVESGLDLVCEVRRGNAVPLPSPALRIDSRVGIDINPLDLGEADDRLWLRALIWPEQRERAVRLSKAIEIFQRNPVKLVRGEALEVLPNLLNNAPPGLAICLFSSFTLNQISVEVRDLLAAFLREFSHDGRKVFFLTLGGATLSGEAGQEIELWLNVFERGSIRKHRLALCAPHGGWVDWLGRDDSGGRPQ